MRYNIKRGEKIINEGDNSGVLGEHSLSIDDQRIVHIMPESEQKVTWNGIKKMEETETYYFLYDTALSAIIIPKFKIPNELKEVDQMLKKYLKNE